jgi:hypothetical protein
MYYWSMLVERFSYDVILPLGQANELRIFNGPPISLFNIVDNDELINESLKNVGNVQL